MYLLKKMILFPHAKFKKKSFIVIFLIKSLSIMVTTNFNISICLFVYDFFDDDTS